MFCVGRDCVRSVCGPARAQREKRERERCARSRRGLGTRAYATKKKVPGALSDSMENLQIAVARVEARGCPTARSCFLAYY